MAELHIALNEIAPEGMRLEIEDQSLWTDPLREFRLKFRIARPLKAEVFLFPQVDGCLVRGSLSGELAVPCDRCAEDARVIIEQSFDEFEPFPSERSEADDGDFEIPESSAVFFREGSPILDLGGLLWEELSLSLPVKPLCRPGCRGSASCAERTSTMALVAAVKAKAIPRLAVLKQIKVKTKG